MVCSESEIQNFALESNCIPEDVICIPEETPGTTGDIYSCACPSGSTCYYNSQTQQSVNCPCIISSPAPVSAPTPEPILNEEQTELVTTSTPKYSNLVCGLVGLAVTIVCISIYYLFKYLVNRYKSKESG
jgi:hypothetical protein